MERIQPRTDAAPPPAAVDLRVSSSLIPAPLLPPGSGTSRCPNPLPQKSTKRQIMVDNICDVPLKDDGEHPEEGEEVCVFQLKGTVPARILKITQTLADLLYEFVNSFTSWHQFSRGPSFFWANGRFIMFSNETVPVRLIRPGMRKYMERESGCFQMMTSSWVNHQIQVHSDRVQLALMKDSSLPGEVREPLAIGPTIFEVLNILSEDVNYIPCNVLTLYDLSDSEFQDLVFESSLEVKQVAAEITELMNKQKKIGNTISTFLAKEYVKASIHCMVKQTSRMHYQVGAVEKSRRSLQIVVDEFWDFLLNGGEPEQGKELKDTVPLRIPEITQTLVDLLFEFVIASSIWQNVVNASWMSSEGVRSKMFSDETIIEYQKGIQQDIWRLSESFLKEMSWWMNHQIQVHSERVPEVLVAEVRETLLAAAVSGPVCEETPAKRTPKRRGAIGQTISKVLNILSEDVNCILCNVLTSYELSDSEFEDLQFESSLEAGQVAGEITELMEQQRSTGNTIRMFFSKGIC
ncbi:hypothetical protein NQZ68_011128 [Dissostichus eleginoides]|nr:hypothetical protein NQZ68_011128 [Dissostichus eleginoides]